MKQKHLINARNFLSMLKTFKHNDINFQALPKTFKREI